MRSMAEIRQEILDRASSNAEFRSQLITEPKAALADAFDITLPDGFHLKVHEDGATNAHLVLPPTTKLTDEELTQVAGGYYNRLFD